MCVDVLPFLMRISLQLNEEMAPLIVKLITIGLSGVSVTTETHKRSHSSKGISKTSDAAKTKSTSKQPSKLGIVYVYVYMLARTCTRMHTNAWCSNPYICAISRCFMIVMNFFFS